MEKLHGKRGRTIFLLVSFLLWFPHFLYVPILSPYLEFLGGKYAFIGIVLGSYGMMQLLCRIPIGIFSDLLKARKAFVVFGMISSALSCVLFSISDHLGLVLLARCLAGLAAASWVVFTVLYSSYFRAREVHRAMGNISFIVVLAQFLGMSLGGYIADEWGWRGPFWLGAVFSLAGVILSFFINDSEKKAESEPLKVIDLVSVMREPMLLKASLLSVLAHSMIFTTMYGFIPTYVIHIGLEAGDISLLVVAFMIPHAIATLFIGKFLVPFLGKWRSLKTAFLMAAIFTMLIPLAKSLVVLIILQAFSGFALGLIFPLLLGMSVESIPQEKRATAMGAYQALYAIGIFAGPFIAGIFISIKGIETGFYFAGLLGLAANLFILYWDRIEVHSKQLARQINE
ncbi:MFS transporter [Mesobacillus foraminis]|uniref:MFS transporter n=1 Tax=Mesobacillus foraminis TaxID=279826 RepID=UPI00214B547C|nr:MFS transporter [Mesobacillus foraminis]